MESDRRTGHTDRHRSSPLSLWHDTLAPGDDLRPRQALPGDTSVDVAIVGGGFGGLWTAYYLRKSDPSLRVLVIEREVAGFGASGRNGGWCVGDQGASVATLDKAGGPGSAEAFLRALHSSVDEVGDVVGSEQIDCGYAKGGALYLASNAAQLSRLRKRADTHERHGLGDVYVLLGREQTRERIRADGVVGSSFTPHAARLHPARLARGLARAVERSGGVIREGTQARAIEPGRVETDHGTVRAEIVVRATEAYTATLEGHKRTILPVGNFMIATEPISPDRWEEIGLAGHELFEDSPHLLAYGQRTPDDRIAWGGMGAPYWWGSRIPPSPMTADRIAARLRRQLVARFPALEGIGITHHWGGVLGLTRDLHSSVGLDRGSGLAWVGAYGGAGLAASNLAGRTLADLVAGRVTDLTRLAWVDHRSRAWEPEPLRWLGVHTVANLARAADAIDGLRG